MTDAYRPTAIAAVAAFGGRRSTATRSASYRTRNAVARCVVAFNMMDPAYWPSLVMQNDGGTTSSSLGPDVLNSLVVGKISSWIDLDSPDETIRGDSEKAFKDEIEHASRLSLQACLVPAPKGNSFANYARCVNQALQALDTSMQLWLRIPLVADSMDATPRSWDDSWEVWNSFRLLCGHQHQLSVALDITSISLPSANSLRHWFGESVRAMMFHTDCFVTTPSGYPRLSEHHEKLLSAFFNPSIQVILSEELVHCQPMTSSDSPANSYFFGVEKHPLRPYVDQLASLCEKMDALPEQQRLEVTCTDFFQLLSRTLMDNLEAEPCHTFEKDTTEDIQYKTEIGRALQDRVPDAKASSITTVLIVLGAGCGRLVRAALQAAKETGRSLKVYAVEKDPDAVVTLDSLVKLEGWEDIVSVISSDTNYWDPPDKPDILVCELWSTLDNELFPEWFDGPRRLLKEDGITIPSIFLNLLCAASVSFRKASDGTSTSADVSTNMQVGRGGAVRGGGAQRADAVGRGLGRDTLEYLDAMLGHGGNRMRTSTGLIPTLPVVRVTTPRTMTGPVIETTSMPILNSAESIVRAGMVDLTICTDMDLLEADARSLLTKCDVPGIPQPEDYRIYFFIQYWDWEAGHRKSYLATREALLAASRFCTWQEIFSYVERVEGVDMHDTDGPHQPLSTPLEEYSEIRVEDVLPLYDADGPEPSQVDDAQTLDPPRQEEFNTTACHWVQEYQRLMTNVADTESQARYAAWNQIFSHGETVEGENMEHPESPTTPAAPSTEQQKSSTTIGEKPTEAAQHIEEEQSSTTAAPAAPERQENLVPEAAQHIEEGEVSMPSQDILPSGEGPREGEELGSCIDGVPCGATCTGCFSTFICAGIWLAYFCFRR